MFEREEVYMSLEEFTVKFDMLNTKYVVGIFSVSEMIPHVVSCFLEPIQCYRTANNILAIYNFEKFKRYISNIVVLLISVSGNMNIIEIYSGGTFIGRFIELKKLADSQKQGFIFPKNNALTEQLEFWNQRFR